MPEAVLTISSRNYSSWCLRGWLMCRLAGLDFAEEIVPVDDPAVRAKLLLLSPSFLLPCLTHDGAKVWDALAIGEYLAELRPQAGLLPAGRIGRAHCRAVCAEMHAGFYNLRSALPMNLKGHHPGYKIWAGAQTDIDRVVTIWSGCLKAYGGPYLFGPALTIADAMYAPVVTRFATYDVQLNRECTAYCRGIQKWPAMAEWTAAAKAEPAEIEELDMEF